MSDIGVLVTLDEEALKNQAILDYTSRDFVAIRAQLVGLAKGIMPDWSTAGEASDFGTLLLELFAYMGDTLNYYIDRTASEAFLSTAVRKQSVFYIADMLGYQPIGQHAASVYLSFSMEDPAEEQSLPDVVLPKGTKVTSSADNADSVIVFETAQEITLHQGDTDKQVFAEEGVTVDSLLVGVSAGVPNSEFILPNTGVIHGSISCVTTEGFQTVLWAYTSDLSLARPSQPVFTTYMDDAGATHIVFGDNASGRIPAISARVFASYRYGVGAVANTLAEDTLTTIIPPPRVDLSFITVTNTESPAGGSDPETISSLKFNIPRAGARIRSRAVTLADYAHLALQVPGVSKAIAYGTVYTAVHVRIAPADGRATVQGMLDLISAVEQYLADKILIGSSVIAEPEDLDELFLDTYLRISVHAVSTFNRTSVRNQVDAVLRKQLGFDNVDFGYRITLGGVYRAALSVQGVEWAEVRWLSTSQPTDQPVHNTTDTPPAAENLINGTWLYDSSVLSADPGTGEYRTNSTGGVTPTQLLISKRDTNYATTGEDHGITLLALQVGDHIVYRPALETWAWYDLIVQEAPVDHAGSPGYVEIVVAINQTEADPVLPTAGGKVLFQFLRYNPTPVSSGNIGDVVTGELQIPRIEPTEIIEDEDAVSEVQRITPTGTVSGGTWTLTFPSLTGTSVTTAPIVYNATAGQIRAAINLAIPNTVVTDKKITVTGGPINTAYVTLTYAIGYGDVAQATVDTTLLTGTSPVLTVTTITEGIVGNWIAAGLTEEERTHDGLWVIATGGVANS